MTPRNQKPAWEDMVDRTPAQPAPPPRPPREKLQKDSKDRAMAAYMTHELRAPLTSIRSALGILDMQMAAKLAPEEKQILMMATRNADRLDALINDIMDFTKIRAGKL
ncbi:MAG: histidine kinase dimerization/phospho-acceptor domain-containing protein, partial [Elusimicrobiota bacterium]